MTRIQQAAAVAVMALAVFSACGPTGSSDAGVDAGCGPGEPNDTRETATVIATDAGIRGACVGPTNDPKDFYQFVAPNDSAGGYIKIDVTNVSTVAGPEGTIFSAADNGQVFSKYEADVGKNLSMWAAVAPGATYRFEIHPFASDRNMSYDLGLSYTPFVDTFEPNNRKEDAKAITVGTAIQASFAAVSANAEFTDGDAEDWFKTTVGAGTATIKVSNVASDYGCDVEAYDATGTKIGENYSTTPGANCQLDLVSLLAGEIKLNVHGFASKPPRGGSGTVSPTYTSQYTLLVSQP